MMENAVSDRRSGSDRRGRGDRRTSLDRRSGEDRRQTVPETRHGGGLARLLSETLGSERRSGRDRRSGNENRIGIDRRCGIDRRVGAGWRNVDLGEHLSPENALDLVSDFYSASMDSRFWPAALTKLAEALGAGACALARHDFGMGQGRIDHAIGFEVTAIESFGAHYAATSEWLQHEEAFREPGDVLTGEDLVAEDAEERSEFFSHWLVAQAFRHQVFAIVDRQGSDVHYLYAARSASAGPFDDAEVALLRRLLPYLHRGLRAGQVLRRTQNLRQVAMDALDVMPIGVLLISAAGAVLGANRVGRDVLAAREVLWSGRGGLEINRNGRRMLFRDLLADLDPQRRGNRSEHPQGFSVARANGQRALSVLIWPVAGVDAPAAWDDPAAVVFLGDPDRAADIDEDRLRQLYGLTRAEARVAAELARGHRLDEIAEELDVAYETTRKHLKKVLAKVETDRQADLVRTIVTGPGIIAP